MHPPRLTSALRLTLAAAALLAVGCSTPLAIRGARVMEPGEVEVLASPQLQVASVSVGGFGASPALTYPWIEGSVRFGLIDRLDMQLRFDPSLFPEISFGYQFIGDPSRDDDFALTLTGGVKATFAGAGGGLAAYFNLPIQLLVDIPVGESFGLLAGLRVIPNGFFGIGGGSGGLVAGAAPGGVVGLRFKLGAVVISPEFAVSSNFPFLGTVSGGGTTGGLGLATTSGTFGLNIGGQFGGPDKKPAASSQAPAPPASAADAPTPAPEPTAPPPSDAPASLDPATPG